MKTIEALAVVVAAAGIIAAQPAYAGQSPSWLNPEPELVPDHFLTVGVLDINYELPLVGELRLGNVDYMMGRWLAGFTVINGTNAGSGDLDELVTRIGEIRFGWCPYRMPRSVFGSQTFYGMVPEVIIGVEGGVLPALNAKAYCRVQVDYAGLGLALEAGGKAFRDRFGNANWNPYAGVGLRLLAFNLGL